MKTFVLLAVLAFSVLSMPFDVKPLKADQCGAKQLKQQYRYIATGESKTDVTCELCLDLVLIAETYAECDEAEVEHKMEEKCDKDYKGAADKACREMVDKYGHEIITDTEEDPSKVCYKVVHKHCTYSL